MKNKFPLVFFWLGMVTSILHANSIPYTGKISLDGINFEGQANFQFTIYTEVGKAVWRNGKDAQSSISVPVKQGRYSVLLGGQGMDPISPELFLNYKDLFLSVYVDLNDGKGLRHLPPDLPIHSVPHALSADLAERAKVADGVVNGAINKQMLGADILADLNRSISKEMLSEDVLAELNRTIRKSRLSSEILADLNRTISKNMLGQDVKNQLDAPVTASRLDPVMKAYLVPLLKPVATSQLKDEYRWKGKKLELVAPQVKGENLSYTWFKDDHPISDTHESKLIIENLNASKHEGKYGVVVSNDFGDINQSLYLSVMDVEASKIAIGDNHLLFITQNGNLYGIGQNVNGEIGAAQFMTSLPALITEEKVLSVFTSVNTTLFYTDKQELFALGNLGGVLGKGAVKSPHKVYEGPLQDFACGAGSFFLVKQDGSLWTAGVNNVGQLGINSTDNSSTFNKVFDAEVVKVHSRGDHVAVVKEDGSLWTFGHNHRGQLGNGTKLNSKSPFKAVSSGVVGAVTFSENTIFFKGEGSLWGLGRSHFGMFPTSGDNLYPIQISDSNVKNASLGFMHLLYVKDDGSVWGRGRNDSHQLGINNYYSNPVKILHSSAVDVKCGIDFSAILLEDGKILTFGNNKYGQLGTGEPIWYTMPQKLDGLKIQDAATTVSASFFVDMEGALWSVGYEHWGELGDAGQDHYQLTPLKVVDENVISVEAKNSTVLYRDKNGSLLGFGSGGHGRLANNSTSHRTTPTMVIDENVISYTTGADHSGIVLADGSLWMFGNNNHGELGKEGISESLVPIKIVDDNVTQISAGWDHTLFLKNDDSVWGMGRNNDGQLGDGSTLNRTTPIKIIEENAIKVVAGNAHSFVIMSDGSLLAFGSNGQMRAGLPVHQKYLQPTLVFESGVVDVSAGGTHSLFLKNDGSLWVSGINEYGKVGAGEINEYIGLSKIAESGVAGISASSANHSIYWLENGDVYTFGSNFDGQLGIGRKISTWEKQTIYDPNE